MRRRRRRRRSFRRRTRKEDNVEDQGHDNLGLRVLTCTFYENKFHNGSTMPSQAVYTAPLLLLLVLLLLPIKNGVCLVDVILLSSEYKGHSIGSKKSVTVFLKFLSPNPNPSLPTT